MEEEFVEGDRATKGKVLGFLGVCALLIGVWIFGAEPLFDFLTAPSATTSPVQSLKRTTDVLLMITLVVAAVSWGLSISFLRVGIRVKRSGRWPPPGMRVAVRTNIRRGNYAVFTWLALFTLAVVCMVKPVFNLYAWYRISQLSSELGLLYKQIQPKPKSGAADLPR
jgi:hypothetical protein